MTLDAQTVDLYQIYEQALFNDPTFQGAGAANRAAKVAPDIAKANLLPSINATVSTTGNMVTSRSSSVFERSTGTRKFNDHNYLITITQPLYRKGRWIALDQARVEVDQANATFAFEHQALMLRAAQRYFDVLSAADTLTFARAEQDAFAQQLEQSQQRFEVGLIAVTDVEEAKAGFDLARAQVIQAENALDNAREALRELTGQYHLSLTRLSDGEMPLEVPTPDRIEDWTETALERNLQLAGQIHAARRAKLDIKREESGHMPTLDLVGTRGRNVVKDGTTGGGSGERDNTNTEISLRLSIPLYAGGSIVSRTRQSRHLYQREVDEVERVRRSVQRLTRDAFLGVRSGISRVNALEQAVKSSEAAADAVEAGFQVGTRTTVDVLNAKRDLFRAKRDLADARYNYIVDTLTLKQAAGILEEEDLRLVNSWLQ